MRTAAVALISLAVLACPSLARATTYYVSQSGSDGNAGTSPTAAWRTVGRVNDASLVPGDSVLFQGGATFPGLLLPPASGTAGAPIRFSSDGAAKPNLPGGIALASRSWLVFDNLTVDTGDWHTAGNARGIISESTGTGAKHIVVQNCSFLNVSQGLLLSNHADSDWTVRDNLIRYTRDSAVVIFDPNTTNGIGGDSLVFVGNTILDAGLDPTLAFNKHGVYDKGTNTTFRDNTVSRAGTADPLHIGAAFSIRAHNTVLEGNLITEEKYGISWAGYDSAQGTTRIAYNRLSDIGAEGITLASNSGPVPTVENFIVANNTIVTSSPATLGRGIHTQATAGFLKIANNIVTGTQYYGLWVDGIPSGGFSEHNDLWDGDNGTAHWNFMGTDYATLAGYQQASGGGGGDRVGDPLIDAALVPGAASPALDDGTTAVDGSISFVGDCAHALYHFCGAAPDMGAEEIAGAAAQALPPPPALPAPKTDTTPPAVAVPGLSNGSIIARSSVLTVTATDASGIKSVSFSLDGKLACLDLAGPYSCAMSLTHGWHKITVKATDNAGNSTTVSVRVKAASRELAVLSSHASRRAAGLAVVRVHRDVVLAHRHARRRRFQLTMHGFRLTIRIH